MNAHGAPQPMRLQARDIVLTGRVQGVGFRPFVYRLAHELGISGSVLNGSGKVFIHAEGEAPQLDRLERDLIGSAPPLARPVLAESCQVPREAADGFVIRASADSDEAEIHVPPDLFTCDACVAELSDPAERRHGYPFINCTQCGPRYTIITGMPYDRPNTSMQAFPLCPDCRREYESPLDRRFHAQPLACAECGPRLTYVEGPLECAGPQALEEAIDALAGGKILAVKGVGGYHLLCDAAQDEAVGTLRSRKCRPHKPLAVMFPLRGPDGLACIRQYLAPDAVECAALVDPARPIVLVRRRDDHGLSAGLAPGLGELGAFLPYSPLHHLLMRAFGKPVVATSGNISGEPVITDNEDAARRLRTIADAFLHHDRPIVRPADDSVVRVMLGEARPIRLGRGLAPTELDLPVRLDRPILATGGHMKSTVALGWDNRVVVSPHIGELDSPRSQDIFRRVIDDLQRLYGVSAECVVTDAHPGYASSRWAARQPLPVIRVQHHAAHASALAGEHADIDRWLVFTWDGVGLGPDGSLWGGEALLGGPGQWQRAASFRTFRLSGGDRAGREPWRAAAALAWAEDLAWQTEIPGAEMARDAWRRGINTLETSAAGRLFDAAACLVLGRELASFEGQGPMELEQAAGTVGAAIELPMTCDADGIWRTDWSPMLPVLAGIDIDAGERARVFHATMARALVDQAVALRKTAPFEAVGLSGGVFQNRLLTRQVVSRLNSLDIPCRLHQRIPANDGGLSFGQIIEASQS